MCSWHCHSTDQLSCLNTGFCRSLSSPLFLLTTSCDSERGFVSVIAWPGAQIIAVCVWRRVEVFLPAGHWETQEGKQQNGSDNRGCDARTLHRGNYIFFLVSSLFTKTLVNSSQHEIKQLYFWLHWMQQLGQGFLLCKCLCRTELFKASLDFIYSDQFSKTWRKAFWLHASYPTRTT